MQSLALFSPVAPSREMHTYHLFGSLNVAIIQGVVEHTALIHSLTLSTYLGKLKVRFSNYRKAKETVFTVLGTFITLCGFKWAAVWYNMACNV